MKAEWSFHKIWITAFVKWALDVHVFDVSRQVSVPGVQVKCLSWPGGYLNWKWLKNKHAGLNTWHLQVGKLVNGYHQFHDSLHGVSTKSWPEPEIAAYSCIYGLGMSLQCCLLMNIGAGNGLSPVWHQAIAWTGIDLLRIGLITDTVQCMHTVSMSRCILEGTCCFI